MKLSKLAIMTGIAANLAAKHGVNLDDPHTWMVWYTVWMSAQGNVIDRYNAAYMAAMSK